MKIYGYVIKIKRKTRLKAIFAGFSLLVAGFTSSGVVGGLSQCLLT